MKNENNSAEKKDVGRIVLFYISCFLFVWLLFGFAAFVFPSTSKGAEVNAATFSVGKIYNKRDYYLTDYTLLREGSSYEGQTEKWNHQIDLHSDISLFDFGRTWGGERRGEIYWVQDVVGESTTSQYRKVHWEFEWGINIMDKFDLFHHHRSEHALDRSVEATAGDAYLGRATDYPLLDVYGVRFCFLGSRCGR